MRIKLNYQGMSLVEMMAGLLIFSLVSLSVSSLVTKTQSSYFTLSQKITLEAEAEQLSFILKRYFAQAVELNLAPAIGGAISNLDGRIVSIDTTTAWDPSVVSAPAIPVGLFYTDDNPSDLIVNNNLERFLPVAVVVQPSTVSKYGLIVVHVGRAAAANGNLSVASPENRFTNIVDFKIVNIVTESWNGSNRVVSFSIVFTERIYRDGDSTKRTWCPPTQMTAAPCVTDQAYTDITKYVDIVVRNNVIGESDTYKIGDTVSPVTGQWFAKGPRRWSDGIYFYRPRLPVEALKR